METISVKVESSFLKQVESTMKKHHYATTAEFVREALREKVQQLEIEDRLKLLDAIVGKSKRKITSEQLRKAREEAVDELEKELGL